MSALPTRSKPKLKSSQKTNKQITQNFNLKELETYDIIPAKYFKNCERLLKNLQVLRDELGAPVIIHSGYRDEQINIEVGGVSESQHLKGKAADISCPGFTSYELYCMVALLINEGRMTNGGLGLYNNFLHYDIRGYHATWNYSTKYNVKRMKQGDKDYYIRQKS